MIGQLRERITLKNPTVTLNAGGGTTKVYSSFATVWAEARKLNAHYKQEGGTMQLQAEYAFTVRYSELLNSSLNKSSQVAYNGKTFGVVAIEKVEEKDRYIIIKANTVSGGV